MLAVLVIHLQLFLQVIQFDTDITDSAFHLIVVGFTHIISRIRLAGDHIYVVLLLRVRIVNELFYGYRKMAGLWHLEAL